MCLIILRLSEKLFLNHFNLNTERSEQTFSLFPNTILKNIAKTADKTVNNGHFEYSYSKILYWIIQRKQQMKKRDEKAAILNTVIHKHFTE